MLIAFNKPFGVLSQFTPVAGKQSLADFIDVANVYPAGRLDHDSEGLLLLTDHGPLQHAIADPSHGAGKHYWAQVEGIPSDDALARFAAGLDIGEGADRYRTRPARVETMTMPMVPERDPPIRTRLAIPTVWLSIRIAEGRNRQVRRMTAAIGHPTLRLIRAAIGEIDLAGLGLAPGMWCEVNPARLGAAFGSAIAAPDGANPPVTRKVSTGFRKRRYWG
jgi:23S rRNA pseudouridine2457 synthase